MNKKVALIGYSGHAFVVADILLQKGRKITGYCETREKDLNPHDLKYLGNENEPNILQKLHGYEYVLSVGDNILRQNIFSRLTKELDVPMNAIHPSANIAAKVSIGKGVMLGAGSIINPLVIIGDGVICNSGCVIEHECRIGKFSHIAPSATLLGNVEIGESCLIGANAVVKPGVKIGDNVTIGAGSVVLDDIPNGAKVAGNPARKI